LDSKHIAFLVKLRDGAQMIADATQEYLESLAPTEVKEEKPAVNENTFSLLKFEPQQGAKIGSYEVACKPNNITDKWTHAYDVLDKANATIKERYHDQGYEFSYWLYGQDKIYRQLKKTAGDQPRETFT
jgi:hypothetical protein